MKRLSARQLKSGAAAWVLLATAACSSGVDRSEGVPYATALAACRAQHSGQTPRSIGMDSGDAHVAECLRSKGWQPDGRPLPVAVSP